MSTGFSLYTRAVKGSSLTWAQFDNNWLAIQNAIENIPGLGYTGGVWNN